MSKAANSNITAPDVPGGRTDDERCERLAGPAVGPEPAALFLPPGLHDIRIGRADVHLVLAHLSDWGIPARAVAPGSAYDVIAEPGEAFGRLRIRVRTVTVAPRRPHRFALYRGRPARPVRFDAHPGEFDLAAFVALRLGRVQFRTQPGNGVLADAAAFRAHDIGLRSWFAALSALRVGCWTPPGGGDGGAPAWPLA